MLRTTLRLLVLLGGCAGAPDLGEDTAAADPGCADCALTDTHNYRVASTLTARTFRLPAATDAVLDWSAVRTDVQGQPVAPGGIDRVLLVAFPALGPDAILRGLADDTLQQSDAALFVACDPGGATSCRLSDFSILGSTLAVEEVFLAGVGTWMVALTTRGEVGARSFGLLQATDGPAHDAARFDDETAVLEVDVDLRTPAPVVVVPGAAPVVDWTGLARDGLGHALQLSTLDTLMLAHLDASVADVEARVLDLERDADRLWTARLDGTGRFDLSTLDGFDGVTDEGTWWLALRCGTCTHPAPRFLARLEPGEAP